MYRPTTHAWMVSCSGNPEPHMSREKTASPSNNSRDPTMRVCQSLLIHKYFDFILLTRCSCNILPFGNGYHEVLPRLERVPQTFLICILNIDKGPRMSMLAQRVVLDLIQVWKICRTVGERYKGALRRRDRNTSSTSIILAVRSLTAVRRAVSTVGNVFVIAEINMRCT